MRDPPIRHGGAASAPHCRIDATLAARVFNYSGADVNNAHVFLRDSLDSSRNYASFSGTTITDRGNVVLRTTISLPAREYDWWQKHGPVLEIHFRDGNGRPLRQRIELLAGPVGE